MIIVIVAPPKKSLGSGVIQYGTIYRYIQMVLARDVSYGVFV